MGPGTDDSDDDTVATLTEQVAALAANEDHNSQATLDTLHQYGEVLANLQAQQQAMMTQMAAMAVAPARVQR